MRKLKIFFVTLICLLSSNIAFTLGVGEIEVKSALNDPLDAEIKLFSVQPGEGENIRVQLATLKEFNTAGIDRALILSHLKFKIVEKDGKAVIKVFSKRPIREPFLDFLVDIDWPSGRLLREYTLLLDPPVFAQSKAAPVQSPVVARPAEVVREPAPAPAPVERATAPVAAAAVVTEGGDGLFPQIQIGDVAPAPRRPAPVVADSTADTYGPVKRNDTLWNIADSVRPAGVTITQMMIALQQANPEAFGGNNINNLKSGFVLRIPERSEVEQNSAAEALRLSREQNRAWRAGRDAVTPTGTVTTTATTPAAPVSAVKADPEVKLVTPEGDKGTGQGSGTDDSKQLVLANEQLASKEKENTELQQRMQALQDQIESMERLLELKDESLSDLQTKLSDVEKAPAAIEPPPAPVVETKPEPKPEPEPEPKTVTDPDAINPFAVQDLPKVVVPKAPAPKAVPAQQDEGFMAGLLNNPAILGALIAVVVGIIALIWIVMQRRRMSAMQYPESILTGKPDVATQPVSQPTPETDETSLLSDFAPSAMQGVIETDTGEVDPLSEANVYLAYGKHQQAEDLLKDAVQQEPERMDLQLKLMEVYHATGNADGFIKHAIQMHAGMDDQSSALWEKAVEMGRELCPDHELFKAEEFTTEDDFSDLEGLADIDSDLDIAVEEEPEINIEEDLSLDMESLEEVEEDNFSIDLEPELAMEPEATEEVEAAAEPVAVDESDFGELDLDVLADIEDVDTAQEAPAIETEEAETEDEDDILGMDEVATKLDLAKAYIDMGDPDGARAILDEVLTEGSEAQQGEAKTLIDQL